MESRDYIEEIDLQKYWLVIKRRWLPALGVFGAVLTLASLYALSRRPTYQAAGQLLFRSNRTSALTGLAEEIGRLEALGLNNNPLDTQAQIVSSTPILQETINSLSLRDDEGALLKPEDLNRNLEVRGIPGTDVLRIAYKSEDPELAASVVNRLMEIYLQENVQSNRAETAAAREFIASQLPRTESAVQEADRALRRFREQNNIIVLEEEASAAVNIIATLEQQIAQAQSQLVEATARVQELQARVGLDPRQAVVPLSQTAAPSQIADQNCCR
ncbi:GumC family protein [Egbenema bharatensis]|uniref:GumC family protein n=1 Tax=Egbenema bharatensis TaxID=3463334 RepID=UPI003A8615CF